MRLAVLILILAAACNPASAEPIRLMPLGDSVTQGNAAYDTYRYWLAQHLSRAGAEVEFVGSLTDPVTGSYRHEGWDTDHEGRWGLGTAAAAQQVVGWVTQADPDVLIVHLGTNDVGRRENLNEVEAAMRTLINNARRANPHLKILLAQIIPREDHQLAVLDLNQRYADLAAELDSSESPVRVVDCHSGFDPTLDTYDGVHPNESGERRMAAALADALHIEFGIGAPATSGR